MPSSSSEALADGSLPTPSTRTIFFTLYPSIMLPMFLAALDQTIVATALPAIAGSLGEVERVSWVVVSYLIATTIAAPVYGRLGDVLGRKRMMLVALVIFIAASLFCAFAGSIVGLSLARVLQGLGGGGLMTLSQALIGESVPPRERGRFQGYLAGVFMTASTFGPVAGGYLTQHFGWPSVFLVNVPVGLVAIGLALRLPRRPAGGGRLRFDFLGVLLFAAVVAPTLLALEQAQRFEARALPGMIGLAGVAAAALWLLLRHERRSKSPLLPIQLLSQAAIWRCDAMASCIGATIVSLITFLPIYLQVVRGTGPGETGLLMLPLTACIAVGSICTGQLIARTGRTAAIPSVGLGVVTVSLLALAFLAPHLSTRELPWAFGLTSITLGTGMPVVQITVQTVAGRKQLGAAAASVQFSRSIGAAFGTALVGAVLFAVLAATDRHTAALFVTLVERGPSALAALPQARQAIVQAEIGDAFRAALLTIACFAAGAVGLAWSLPMRRI
ncbi:MAG: MFS transporter [Acidisphaera sp.]|nr:MFS transporter [Acidisphaera sp.]